MLAGVVVDDVDVGVGVGVGVGFVVVNDYDDNEESD